ncbi:hypothetical protein VTI28DRAFT_9609 [Corynascus sepedonium]
MGISRSRANSDCEGQIQVSCARCVGGLLGRNSVICDWVCGFKTTMRLSAVHQYFVPGSSREVPAKCGVFQPLPQPRRNRLSLKTRRFLQTARNDSHGMKRNNYHAASHAFPPFRSGTHSRLCARAHESIKNGGLIRWVYVLRRTSFDEAVSWGERDAHLTEGFLSG